MGEPNGTNQIDRRQVQGPAPETERRSPVPRDLELRLERKSNSHLVLHLANELVAHNYYLLDDALERLSPFKSGQVVELEISHVPYADSEAIGRLYAWTRKLAREGARLVVSDPAPYVTSILAVLRMDAALNIEHRHAVPPADETSP